MLQLFHGRKCGKLMGLLALSFTVLATLGASLAQGAETVPAAAGATDTIPVFWLWWVAPIGSLAALVAAWVLYKQVISANEGDDNMKEIAGYVREGAMAYLRRQYKVVALFFVVVCAILYWMGQIGVQHELVFIAFLTGGFFSGLCGFLGMRTATMASNRTTQGAKESLNRGLQVAFRAGAVMGLVVVGFGLLDITMWFIILAKLAPALVEGFHMDLVEITVVMLCFGMGASSQALFARVGGGIYTKAADVGADLVGKVEAGIPEDDPRNPATIADNVGDNVGDVAGMGADLYESYCGSILATAALGVAAIPAIGVLTGEAMVEAQSRMLALPMILAGIGIVMSIIGILMVRTKEDATMKDLLRALSLGVNGSSVLILVVGGGLCWFLLKDIPEVSWLGVFGSIVTGLVSGILIGKSTEYYTSYEYKPTQGIASQAATGPATVIIAGIATGMRSTWASLATVIVAIMLSFGLAGGFVQFSLGLYGVGIAAVGMLSTLGITLATDAYGPIADNAGGNAEMTHQEPHVRKRTDALDSLGNTTAATGKGFAIGSAALTALALMAAYVEEVRVGQERQAEEYVAANTDVQAGETVYVGDWKWARVISREEGEGKAAFETECLMDLSHTSRVGEERIAAGTALDSLEEPDEDNVRRGRLAGVAKPLHLVAAPRASLEQYMAFYKVTLLNPRVLCGIFAGVLLVFLFCAMTMEAVGRAASAMVMEVRRQFKEIAGIMEGTGKPDYARCVAISTAGAQKEMIIPSLLALVVPVGVGLVLDVPGVIGLLAGGLTCGFGVAIFMANAGGAWDNAKKYIETGEFGGKGSDNHKATVVGDTVGDPFKDTSGPSLNILIKLMSMVSVVFAGLVVKFGPEIAKLLGMTN
jgi:H(+)-translocating pyrophosphatase